MWRCSMHFLQCFDLKDVSVQRGFFRKIAADGIEVELDTNGVTAD